MRGCVEALMVHVKCDVFPGETLWCRLVLGRWIQCYFCCAGFGLSCGALLLNSRTYFNKKIDIYLVRVLFFVRVLQRVETSSTGISR